MTAAIKVFLASDHAGVELKSEVIKEIQVAYPGSQVDDLGPLSNDSVDYPDFAHKVADRVVREKALGVLICGSGIGMSIAANKVKGVRAAVVWDVTSARLSREHNDANILCLGSRMVGNTVALDAVKVWLGSRFEGKRHEGRLTKISKLEGGA